MNKTFRDRLVAAIEATTSGDLAYSASVANITRDMREVSAESLVRRVLISAVVDDGIFDDYSEIIRPPVTPVEVKVAEKLGEVAALVAKFTEHLKIQGVSDTTAVMMCVGYSRDLMVERGLVPKPDKFME